jgi:hypothetical protein
MPTQADVEDRAGLPRRARIARVAEWRKNVAGNLARVRERMESAAARAGRSPNDVTLVAISKNFPAEAIRAAYAAGVRHFGENRVQEWESKLPALAGLDGVWHMVGRLQSNKARRAARYFSRVDSVDSIELARRLNQAVEESMAADASAPDAPGKSSRGRLPVLLEVLLAAEETKAGVTESEVDPLAEAMMALPHLEWRGLMCIPPYSDDSSQARLCFRRLAALRDELAKKWGVALPTLSMGMSHDFEVAIEEGATEVRVGTAIFGERATA